MKRKEEPTLVRWETTSERKSLRTGGVTQDRLFCQCYTNYGKGPDGVCLESVS